VWWARSGELRLGKRALRTPLAGGIHNWDLSLFKEYEWGATRPADSASGGVPYNAFNHAQFDGVDTAAPLPTRRAGKVNARFDLGQYTSRATGGASSSGLKFYF